MIVGLIVFAVLGAGGVISVWGRFDFIDLEVYRAGDESWLRGLPLYEPGFPRPPGGPSLPFTYPPLAAAIFSLITVLHGSLAHWIVSIATLGCTAALVDVAARRAGWAGVPAWAYPAIALGCLAFEPVRSTLTFGQINIYLALLVTLDCLVVPARFRGVLTGLAAAIKLTPAGFVLYFAAKKDWRAVGVATGTFVALGITGWLLAPADSLRYWTQTLLDSSRVGNLDYVTNQSLRGILAQLTHGNVTTAWWAGLVVLFAAAAFVTARRLLDRGLELAALCTVALWCLLASPVSWSHHWVWVLPGLIALTPYVFGRSRRRPGAVLALYAVTLVFVLAPIEQAPHPGGRSLHRTPWQQIYGNAYVITGVAALLTATYLLRSRRD